MPCRLAFRRFGAGEGMNRETSIYLDFVRILAAGVVFLAHASWRVNSGGVLWQLEDHGREAVDVFFVLSGFVIGHVVATREQTFATYAIHRAARIWSVALPALVLTFLLDRLGHALRPELYQTWCCTGPQGGGWTFIAGLFFVGDVWTHHPPPGSNVPWWSLGYEVWYYLAFGLLVFLRRPWSIVAALLLLALVGPGIAVLFPLWLVGLGCYVLCARHAPSPAMGLVLWALGLVLLVLVVAVPARYHEIYDPFALTWTRLNDYGLDYAVGLAFALHLLGFRALSTARPGMLEPVAQPLAWFSGATFTLYLMHLPLIHALVALSPWPAATWPTRGLVYLGVPALALLLAGVTERRKTAWRQGITRLFQSERPFLFGR
jgi:peptidoglycan/LPS O-acetylase OafA/YrhL